jgi:hypothetical protein
LRLQFSVEAFVERVSQSPTWDERVQEIRRVPELFGQAQHHLAYAGIASQLYRPHLAAQFAYVQWPLDYQLAALEATYLQAFEMTAHFTDVTRAKLIQVLTAAPGTLRIFRLIIGYTTSEFAAAVTQVSTRSAGVAIGKNRIESMEAGRLGSASATDTIAETIDLLMSGQLWDIATGEFKSKLDKPDTVDGWTTVQQFAKDGVPYPVFLHQRHYGGPFRTLLDATSSVRGDVLELPLEQLLVDAKVPHIRTGAHNQAEIAERFGLTVRPAPDVVVYEGTRSLRAIIECKQTNDGGTARDKASRFTNLANEGRRLGGIPVFAVLDGLGWQRVADALGPVVRDTDGRVFSLATLREMLTVQPFPGLIGSFG